MNKAVRHLVTVLTLVTAMTAMFLITSSNTAQADSPDGQPHFYRTAQYYQSIANAGLNDPTPGKLLYYGGRVMLTSTTYAIYWGPTGHTIPKSYRKLINRYFQDVGGSPFYGINSQYYQGSGANKKFIKNKSVFGGQYVDKTPYPRAGDGSHPLIDSDLRASIARAMAAKGWTGGYGHMFFVFTAKGIESCYDPGKNYCTVGTPNPYYCAYHSSYTKAGQEIIYASMPFGGTWHTGFQYSCDGITKSPNGNLDADIEISPTSHEHEEAVTDADPYGNGDPRTGWIDANGYENADKCAYYYGKIFGDGHNVTMNGHPYVIQLNWSNKAAPVHAGDGGACVTH